MTVPLYNLTDTWNNGATVFTAILMNVTDSASNAASLLMDLQVASASVASITKGGTLTLTGNNNAKLFLHDSNGGDATLSVATSQLHVASIGGLDVQNRINWGSGWGQLSGGNGGLVISQFAGGSGGIVIDPGSDKILEQRTGTTAQTLRVYNTYTNSSNYERHTVDWNTTANVCYVRNENAGTGSARLMVPVTGSTTVSGLPSASTAGAGARAFVTDATATTYNSTVAGTGSNKVPVVSDGTNWLIG